jgi:hypothetical protein
MQVAIEAGTHSPWNGRLLERCSHKILVANALMEADRICQLWQGSSKPLLY